MKPIITDEIVDKISVLLERLLFVTHTKKQLPNLPSGKLRDYIDEQLTNIMEMTDLTPVREKVVITPFDGSALLITQIQNLVDVIDSYLKRWDQTTSNSREFVYLVNDLKGNLRNMTRDHSPPKDGTSPS